MTLVRKNLDTEEPKKSFQDKNAIYKKKNPKSEK